MNGRSAGSLKAMLGQMWKLSAPSIGCRSHICNQLSKQRQIVELYLTQGGKLAPRVVKCCLTKADNAPSGRRNLCGAVSLSMTKTLGMHGQMWGPFSVQQLLQP